MNLSNVVRLVGVGIDIEGDAEAFSDTDVGPLDRVFDTGDSFLAKS